MKYNIEKFDITRDEFEELVRQHIFNEKHRDIFVRRMMDGITYERLAEEFDMSRNQIVNIIYKCGNKIFPKLEKLIIS